MSTAAVDLEWVFAADQRKLAEEWLRISIERFQANLRKLRIGSSQELFNSFRGELVSAAGANELHLRLAYAVQGLFVDLGVGRGMGADYRRLRNDKGHLRRHERKAKRWYSRQMRREQHALGELYSDLTGQLMVAAAQASVPSEPVIVNL